VFLDKLISTFDITWCHILLGDFVNEMDDIFVFQFPYFLVRRTVDGISSLLSSCFTTTALAPSELPSLVVLVLKIDSISLEVGVSVLFLQSVGVDPLGASVSCRELTVLTPA
jgi:hypothetical protein